MRKSVIYFLSLCVLTLSVQKLDFGEVVYAVNCGGDEFIDSLGIEYAKDPLTYGTSSDYGTRMKIDRVASGDQILYQTERYHDKTFTYRIPLKQDGAYVLWLKFSEVWFAAPKQKVFDVVLNDEHVVIENLDIFDAVGRAAALDKYVPFKIRSNKIYINDDAFDYDGTLSVSFVKTDKDNPKVNAIIIVKGNLDEIPRLPPKSKSLKDEFGEFFNDEDISDEIFFDHEQIPAAGRTYSFKENDEFNEIDDDDSTEILPEPYSYSRYSYFLPIVIAVLTGIPLIFLLCKL